MDMDGRRYEPMSAFGQAFDAAERDDGKMQRIIESDDMPVTVMNNAHQTLAHITARFGNVNGTKYLVEKNPSLINMEDGYHCTILHLATVKGSLEIVKYLVEKYNADICHLSGRYKDRTAVHAAVEFNHLHILKYFVEEREIDFNEPHPRQLIPPLFLAVRNRNWDVIEYLVEEKQANVKLLKSNQENILFIIVRENSMSLMKYFLDERGIDFNVNWKNVHGESPVHVAAILGRLEMLKYLVDKKHANVNLQKRTDKRTPLHYAASRDHYECCKFLVERGADARVTDVYGDMPADKAKSDVLIEYLETAAKSFRQLRSVPSYLDPGPSVTHFDSGQQQSIARLPRAIQQVDGELSFPLDAVNVSYFQSFLFLAKSLTKIVRRERQMEHSISFSTPSSILRSRMSSMAIDVIDAETNFRKF